MIRTVTVEQVKFRLVKLTRPIWRFGVSGWTQNVDAFCLVVVGALGVKDI